MHAIARWCSAMIVLWLNSLPTDALEAATLSVLSASDTVCSERSDYGANDLSKHPMQPTDTWEIQDGKLPT